MIVLDDHHLFAVLTGRESNELLKFRDEALATTASWYYRLASAISADSGAGTLTRKFGALSDEERANLRQALHVMPDEITTLGVREFIPVMAALSSIMNVNFLTAEAVATALVLDATIVASTTSALLGRVAAVAGVKVVTVP